MLKNGSLKNNMKSDERPLFQAESDRLDKNLNTSKCESEKGVVVPDIMFLVIANFLQQNPHFGPLSGFCRGFIIIISLQNIVFTERVANRVLWFGSISHCSLHMMQCSNPL